VIRGVLSWHAGCKYLGHASEEESLRDMAHGTYSHETTEGGRRALAWQREQGVGDGEGVTAAATCGVWGVASRPGDARVESRVPVVADLMGKVSPVVPSHLPVWAARKIAQLKKAPAIFVEAEGRLLGVVETRALGDAPDGDLLSAHLQLMSLSVQPTTSLERARELLLRQQVSCLPVAAGMFLVGTISRADVERALAKLPRRAPKNVLARAAA
jgi:CBS domain-containing protein